MAALRAVSPDERPPARRRAKTVTQAASGGSHRELLVAMRDRIARAVEDAGCPPRDLASLTRRLHEIAKDIEAIDARAEQDGDSGDSEVPDDSFDPSAV